MPGGSAGTWREVLARGGLARRRVAFHAHDGGGWRCWWGADSTSRVKKNEEGAPRSHLAPRAVVRAGADARTTGSREAGWKKERSFLANCEGREKNREEEEEEERRAAERGLWLVGFRAFSWRVVEASSSKLENKKRASPLSTFPASPNCCCCCCLAAEYLCLLGRRVIFAFRLHHPPFADTCADNKTWPKSSSIPNGSVDFKVQFAAS